MTIGSSRTELDGPAMIAASAIPAALASTLAREITALETLALGGLLLLSCP